MKYLRVIIEALAIGSILSGIAFWFFWALPILAN